MSVKPIRFTTDEVCATLDGHKTTKRLVVKPQPVGKLAYCMAGYKHGTWGYPSDDVWKYWGDAYKRDAPIPEREKSRHWTPPCHTGDILWVRETWAQRSRGNYLYRAAPHGFGTPEQQDETMRGLGLKWHPSIHMPREAARIWLRVTDVRVERLQAISYEDLQREGGKSDFYKVKRCRACGYGEPHDPECDYEHCDNYERLWEESFLPPFMKLWDSTIKHADLNRYGWAANPWVWVIEFEQCDAPPQWGVQSATGQSPALSAEQKPEEAGNG